MTVGTSVEDFTVHVRRPGARPDNANALALAEWAALQFRLGLAAGEPPVVQAALDLLRALDGEGPTEVGERFASGLGNVADRIEQELLSGRLVAERARIPSLTERKDPFKAELPPLPSTGAEVLTFSSCSSSMKSVKASAESRSSSARARTCRTPTPTAPA
ncbi:MAG: hypothetical protein K0R38_7896 [Polyangiaceae bacterium]|nr:hypothetical protein [Polyangiaceae bacterium]